MTQKKETPIEKVNKTEVAIVDAVEKVRADAKQYLLDSTIKSDADLKSLIETYSAIKIVDKATFDAKKKGSKEMKKIRGIIDKNRKFLTKPLTDLQSEMIAFVKPWTDDLLKTETAMNIEIKAFEDKEKAAAERKMIERQQLFASSGFKVVAGNYVCGVIALTPEQIAKFTEDELKLYIDLGKKEVERVKTEAARIAQEKADFEKEKADFAKRQADLVEREKALAKDKEIVNKLIDKTKPSEPTKPEKVVPDAVEVKPPVESIVVSEYTDVVKLPESEKIISKETIEKIDKLFPPAATEEKPKVESPGPTEENRKKAAKLYQRLGQAGFDNLRTQLIEVVGDRSIKLNREFLIDWAKNAKLKPNKK